MKAESPEMQTVLKHVYNAWDPDVVFDLHTTNGSHHQYTLTYDAPRNPAADPAIIEFTRDRMLPEVGRRLEEASGYMTTFYGRFRINPGTGRQEGHAMPVIQWRGGGKVPVWPLKNDTV